MVKNSIKFLKKSYQAVFKMLNAPDFWFENTTHRVMANEQVWEGYLIVSVVVD